MIVLNAQGHQYGFDSPHFLRYRDPEGREETFPYAQGLRLSVSSWTGEIRVKFPGKSISLDPLSQDQLRDFLLELFRQWNRESPDTAKKAAFDYVDAQRGFVPIAFGASLIVSLPVAIAMLSDSHQQFTCTRELREHAVVGTMQRTKARKKDSRSYVINLEFTAPNGELIKGTKKVMTKDESELPMSYPIFYVPERPVCWTLTKDPSTQEINWAERRYFATFTFLFGMFFLASTMLGLCWSMARWMRPRPFADEIRALFDLK